MWLVQLKNRILSELIYSEQPRWLVLPGAVQLYVLSLWQGTPPMALATLYLQGMHHLNFQSTFSPELKEHKA